MNVYKVSSIKELLSEKCLNRVLTNIRNIKIEHTQTNGLSGSKMYKLTLENDTEDKKLYLKINNLKEDWLAMVNNDTGRELTIFKEDVYIELEEFISDDDIRFIDWANSGCGPCTLDLFCYMMTSVDSKVDKNELIEYYKDSLEKYMGYEFTSKTWNTLLIVGILCSSKMYLPALIGRSNLEDEYDILNIDYWIDSLKNVLINLEVFY